MCGFLFAYWGGFDCFCGKVDARYLKVMYVLKLIEVVILTCLASAFPLKQLLGILWQIKNDTLAGFFDFVGADHCFRGILKYRNRRCK